MYSIRTYNDDIVFTSFSNYDVEPTFSFTFSNDDGDTTEKQTRKTSVCG